MKSRVLARRYAEAFFQVIKSGQLENSIEDFRAFSAAVAHPSVFGDFLKRPAVNLELKVSLVRKSLENASSPFIADFIHTLLRKHRFDLLSIISDEVERLYRKAKSIVRVQVKSAVSLKEDEIELLRERLNKMVNGNVEIFETLDPSIMGGLVIWMEDKLLDGSVKTRLELLRDKMRHLKSKLFDDLEASPSQLF
ncbi:ATP synthase F1 subunit delta [bacterium]|nr:ATP synthase F1 subunit delta [bacterium]